MRRLIYLLPLLAFGVLAAAFGSRIGHDPHALPSVMIDRPVPGFTLPPLPGTAKGVASSDLGGKVQLVNFFASWCIPCKIEHPELLKLLRDHGVTIRGIDYKDDPKAVGAWLAEDGDPYAAIGTDTSGRVAIDFGVYGVPETYVVDRQGKIRYRFAGPLTPEVIDGTILPMLRELSR